MKHHRLLLSTLIAATATTTTMATRISSSSLAVFRSVGCCSNTRRRFQTGWISPYSPTASDFSTGRVSRHGKKIFHLASTRTSLSRSSFASLRHFSSSSSSNDNDNDNDNKNKGEKDELQEIVNMIAEMQQCNREQQQLVSTGKRIQKRRKQQHHDGQGEEGRGEEPDQEEEEDAEDEYDPPDYAIKQLTMDWLKRIVIGLNLCPFADKPVRDDKLKIFVIRGDDPQIILGAILYESLQRANQPGTTLVVAPECFPDDFESYLEVVQAFEEDIMTYPLQHLDGDSLQGIIQVAPFHPHFEFQGSGEQGIDNYTNRSPYPIFHILREEEVEWAVSKLGGDASKVWQRNVELLEDLDESMGRSSVEDLFNVSSGKPVKGQLGKILQRHRLKLSSDGDHDDSSTT